MNLRIALNLLRYDSTDFAACQVRCTKYTSFIHKSCVLVSAFRIPRSRAAPKNTKRKKTAPSRGECRLFGAANGIRVSPAGSVFRGSDRSRLRARSRSGSDSPPDCHSLPSRRFATPDCHSLRSCPLCVSTGVSRGNATTNKPQLRPKCNVRGALPPPNPIYIIKIHPPSGWYFIFGHSPNGYWQRTSAFFDWPASHATVTYYP